MALSHDLRACWSKPILSTNGEVLGSFAVYYTKTKKPNEFHLKLIERFTHLSGVAIEKFRSTQREQALIQQIKRSNEKFSSITKVMPDVAIVFDIHGTYIDLYGALYKVLTDNPRSLIGKTLYDVLPLETAISVHNTIKKTLSDNKLQVLEYEIDSAKGCRTFEGRTTLLHDYLRDGQNEKHVLWMSRDVTEKKVAEHKITQLAFFDPLTNLPNRRLLIDRLQVLIEKAARDKTIGAILYIDLDNFKRINDSLGHAVGDQLLLNVAERLRPIIRSTDTIARIGGDEFVVLLENLENSEDKIGDEASLVAEKLITAFHEKFKLHNGEYRIGCSIGISLIKGVTLTADEALSQSDTAMYRAKKLGGGSFSFFDPSLQKIISQRLQLERDILVAIEEKQFHAHFQPQITAEGKLIGAEALARWVHPEKGDIPPLEFIPIAEQFGLIHKLQNIILSDCCELLNQLKKINALPKDFSLSINISAPQFKTQKLMPSLLKILAQHHCFPSDFKLEITESMLIEDIDYTIQQMSDLKNQGFKFSIDDFGTGYSSLTYLHTFPIDELKIDKSFIDKMLTEETGTAIVDTIVSLSDHLGFTVIAEGVEKTKQVELLSERNVSAMQGFNFAKPMSPDNFVEWACNFDANACLNNAIH